MNPEDVMPANDGRSNYRQDVAAIQDEMNKLEAAGIDTGALTPEDEAFIQQYGADEFIKQETRLAEDATTDRIDNSARQSRNAARISGEPVEDE